MRSCKKYIQMKGNMIRRFTLLFTAIILFTSGYAQQDPQYSFNMFNHMSINPGFAGSNGAICANGIYRKQWMGFEGAPTTIVFNAHMPIKSISSGAGISVLKDEQGFEKSINLKLSYAYRLNLDDAGTLGIGLSFGFLNRAIDGEWKTFDFLVDNNNDPHSDPAVPLAESHFAFDMDFGLFYKVNLNDNLLYAGLSTSHLTEPKLKFTNGKVPYSARHYYLTAGYYYTLPEEQWELRPSFMIKSDGVTNAYDLNVNLIYEKKYWVGVTYRMNESVDFLAGVQLPMNLIIAIAYDYNINKFRYYNNGSIEIMAQYCFNVSSDKGPSRNKSVRFL